MVGTIVVLVVSSLVGRLSPNLVGDGVGAGQMTKERNCGIKRERVGQNITDTSNINRLGSGHFFCL